MKKSVKIISTFVLGVAFLASCEDDHNCLKDTNPVIDPVVWDECHDSSLIVEPDSAHQIAWMYIDPVCGCDGVTYANARVARESYGVKNYTPGECGKKKNIDTSSCYDASLINNNPIPAVYLPVCGCDGVTYSSAEEATNHYGVKSYTKGECGKSEEKEESECYDKTLITNEPIPAVYIPVCGCDGVTYSSSMEATTHYGVKHYTNGACGQKNDSTIVILEELYKKGGNGGLLLSK